MRGEDEDIVRRAVNRPLLVSALAYTAITIVMGRQVWTLAELEGVERSVTVPIYWEDVSPSEIATDRQPSPS